MNKKQPIKLNAECNDENFKGNGSKGHIHSVTSYNVNI